MDARRGRLGLGEMLFDVRSEVRSQKSAKPASPGRTRLVGGWGKALKFPPIPLALATEQIKTHQFRHYLLSVSSTTFHRSSVSTEICIND